jgi:hypothetical protein
MDTYIKPLLEKVLGKKPLPAPNTGLNIVR